MWSFDRERSRTLRHAASAATEPKRVHFEKRVACIEPPQRFGAGGVRHRVAWAWRRRGTWQDIMRLIATGETF